MRRFSRSRRKRPNLAEAEEFLRRGHGVNMAASHYVSVEERRQRLAKLAQEVPALLRAELAKVRSLDLAVLKCHLLLEFMLNQFIDLTAPTEGALGDARLSFKQKPAVAHALGLPADPLFLPSLDLLNTIRNQVAHTLAPNRALIDKLVRINSEEPDEVQNLTDAQRVAALKQITRFCCAKMLGMIEGLHAVEMLDVAAEQRASADGATRRR